MADAIAYLRSFRIARMSVFDWAATVIGAVVTARYFGFNMLLTLLILLIISIPLHRLFGVKTFTNYYIGYDSKPRE
jgi:hypothetical protein